MGYFTFRNAENIYTSPQYFRGGGWHHNQIISRRDLQGALPQSASKMEQTAVGSFYHNRSEILNSRFDDRKRVCISNIKPLNIYKSREPKSRFGTHYGISDRDAFSEFLYPLYIRRICRIIETQGPAFSGHISEKEVVDRLTIDKPKSIFNEILSCISVPPEGNCKKPRLLTENLFFGIGLGCSALDFLIKLFFINSFILLLKLVGTPLTAVSAVFAATNCAHGIFRSHAFRKNLDRIMQDKTLPENERAKNMLKFVYEKTLLSPQEIENIQNKILKKMPNQSNEERFQALKKKVLDLAIVKINDLKKLAGHKGVKEIIRNAELIMESLDDPAKVKKAIEDGKKLHDILKSENLKRIRFNSALLVTSLLTFAISAVTFALLLAAISTGIGGLILLGISIALIIIWALLASYYIRDMLMHRMQKTDLHYGTVKQ